MSNETRRLKIPSPPPPFEFFPKAANFFFLYVYLLFFFFREIMKTQFRTDRKVVLSAVVVVVAVVVHGDIHIVSSTRFTTCREEWKRVNKLSGVGATDFESGFARSIPAFWPSCG